MYLHSLQNRLFLKLVQIIFIFYHNMHLLNMYVMVWYALLLQAYVTIADLGLSCVGPLVLLLPNTFKLYGLPIFRFWSWPMKVMSETHRAYYIWYQSFYFYYDNWNGKFTENKCFYDLQKKIPCFILNTIFIGYMQPRN